ncbi:MAG: hypothetical protein JNL11_20765 [Bdellovibrionaceae bacterium]|nr:hypothetical protein [Pseudobdellovibrionaceae bacterium]
MNLSVLFWILISISFVLPLTSFFGFSTEISALIQMAAALMISVVYVLNNQWQRAQSINQAQDHQAEVESLRSNLQSRLDQTLASLQSARSTSEQASLDINLLDNQVQTTSENAKHAALLSQQSRTRVESSVKSISELHQSMNQVSMSSKKIEEILRLIEDIAFQTNLLALNAAVEAARAGEQGKGFAVVAEAVRTLAQKSSIAAKDIRDLISETTTRIQHGCQHAQNSQGILNDILEGILKVSDINNEISLSNQDQATRTRQLKSLLSDLSKTQHEIAAKMTLSPLPANQSTPQKKMQKTTQSVLTSPTTLGMKNKTTKAKSSAMPWIPPNKGTPITTMAPPPPLPTATITHVIAHTPVIPKTKTLTTKTPQELIPFDEDEDRLKLTQASDF